MKRKIIKQGNNTLTITLPRKWTRKFDIEAGDEINLEEQEKALLITSEKVFPLIETSIDVTGLNQPLIWRYLMAAYRAGYDKIEVKYSDPDAIYENIYTSLSDFRNKVKMNIVEVIQDLANRFVGMEIIDQKKNCCILKDLGEITDKEFENALRRIFLLLITMAEDSLNAFKTNSIALIKSIDIKDTNIDRFVDYCLRVLNKKGYKNFKKTSIIYSIILLLEYVGDEYKKASLYLLKNKKISKTLISILADVNNLLSLFYSLFYTFERAKTLKISEETEKLNKKIEASKLNKDEEQILHHFKKINRFILDLMQLKIDFEV